MFNFVAWIRQRSGLGWFYRRFPLSWRVGAARVLSARAFASVRFPRTPAWDRALPAPPVRELAVADEAPEKLGVNILGYIRGQFGLGESARMYARALIEAGVQVRLFDIDLQLPHGWDDHSLDPWIGDDLPYPVSIIFVNPDYLHPALDMIGSARLHGQRLIACWFWELERIPPAWLPAIDRVDEVMVATRFIENAFSSVVMKPVLRVPQPVSPADDSGLGRADFGLEEGKFIFLVTFDFNSWVERKNPLGAISAFMCAFSHARDDVRLLIKSSNGHRHQDAFRQLLNAAMADQRITIRDEVIERAHVRALQRCCDAYVSLHRAEGFGLGLAECMAMGKPVIGTAWSGNMDFMDTGNSCLVPCKMVPVAADGYPGGEGMLWAEPDIGQAAAHMRKLAEDRAFAARLGAKAAEDIRRTNSSEKAAQRIAVHLRELAASRPVAIEHIGDAA